MQKDIEQTQKLALDRLAMEIKSSVKLKQYLLNHDCLSITKLTSLINERIEMADAKLAGTLALARSPHLYGIVRDLKLELQNIDENTLSQYKYQIAQVEALVQTGYHKQAQAVLRAQVPANHRVLVAKAAKLKLKNPDPWVLTDRQFLDELVGIASLTHMKQDYCTLHAHLKGRQLETQFLLENPAAIQNFYIDRHGRLLHSFAELVANNFLNANDINNFAQHVVEGLQTTAKHRKADFYLPETHVVIEVSQNHEAGKGVRKSRYLERKNIKEAEYNDAGYRAVFIDTEPFYKATGFDISGFCELLKAELKRYGISTSTDYSVEVLGYSNDEKKKNLIALPLIDLVKFLEDEGIDGLATLKNKFHSYMNILKLRTDFDAVMEHFKQKGLSNRRANTQLAIERRQANYASMQRVKELIRKQNIKSQRDWFSFAKNNRQLLKKLNVPSNLPSVYKRLGTWEGWGALWS
jgi:hypothetical protein